MDDIVNRSTLEDAIQRISYLERMAMNSSGCNVSTLPSQTNDPEASVSYTSTKTATTSINASQSGHKALNELYSCFPSLQRPNPQTGKRKCATNTLDSVVK